MFPTSNGMAEEKKSEKSSGLGFWDSHPDPFVEFVWLILSLFVILYLISGFINLLNSGSLFFLGFNLSGTEKTVPLSKVPSLVGHKVETSKQISVFAEPGTNQIAGKSAGIKVIILEGPIIKDGIKYWKVRFDDGTEGWVAEDGLEYVEGSNAVSLLTNRLKQIFKTFGYVSITFSILLIGFIFFLYKKLVGLRQEEAKKFYIEEKERSDSLNNPHWEKILKNLESIEESGWRLAILEADIMLETLLDNMRLPGETMGDKLRAVEKSDFTTIDNAWEAHKIRNQIAHEGGTFILNQHEARRVIGLYRTVFEEFKII